MADVMLDSIERFTEQNPESSLKLVKIVIFQQSMMQSFRKCAMKKARGKKGWLHGVSALFGRVKGQLLIIHTGCVSTGCVSYVQKHHLV